MNIFKSSNPGSLYENLMYKKNASDNPFLNKEKKKNKTFSNAIQNLSTNNKEVFNKPIYNTNNDDISTNYFAKKAELKDEYGSSLMGTSFGKKTSAMDSFKNSNFDFIKSPKIKSPKTSEFEKKAQKEYFALLKEKRKKEGMLDNRRRDGVLSKIRLADLDGGFVEMTPDEYRKMPSNLDKQDEEYIKEMGLFGAKEKNNFSDFSNYWNNAKNYKNITQSYIKDMTQEKFDRLSAEEKLLLLKDWYKFLKDGESEEDKKRNKLLREDSFFDEEG